MGHDTHLREHLRARSSGLVAQTGFMTRGSLAPIGSSSRSSPLVEALDEALPPSPALRTADGPRATMRLDECSHALARHARPPRTQEPSSVSDRPFWKAQDGREPPFYGELAASILARE